MPKQIVAITVHKGSEPPRPSCQSPKCDDPATAIVDMVAYDSEWQIWSCQVHAEDFQAQIAGAGELA